MADDPVAYRRKLCGTSIKLARLCPACGQPPVTDQQLFEYSSKSHRGSGRPKKDLSRAKAITDEFLVSHLREAGMSLREVAHFHAFTPATLCRMAKQRGIGGKKTTAEAPAQQQQPEPAPAPAPAPAPEPEPAESSAAPPQQPAALPAPVRLLPVAILALPPIVPLRMPAPPLPLFV